MAHDPVMLREAIDALAIRGGGVYVDATFGGGGYTREILNAGGQVIGLDRDPDAIARGAELLTRYPQKLRLIRTPFGSVDKTVSDPVDGIVFDLGVSSFQIDEAERGFSFRFDGPLDMRMSADGPSAADAVAQLSENALAQLFQQLGEEPQGRRIARAIVRAREEAPITRTGALADLIQTALGGRRGAKIHPATRAFQALRMLVNDELGEIARGLAGAELILRPGGRLVVVSFHSLEDRLVKVFLAARARERESGSRHMPQAEPGPAPTFSQDVRRSVAPSDEEVARNPRARSAKLRWAVRTEAPALGAFDARVLAPLALREWESL